MNEQSLFIGALERSADDRAAFLDSACVDQPDLRERLDRLLAAHDSAGDFLQTPASMEATSAEPPMTAGMRIGPYKLLRPLGAGGMGMVFLAEQAQPVQRVAALKIIKPGLDTRQVIARFEGERQALALMEHPNIARVLDAGETETGSPYFVMELVEGVPITQYCDEHQLTTRERLTLFLPVCQALQHAHQKGVIHRDLKPSNVLVTVYDGSPVPKVIDFGVAKATGSSLVERTMCTEIGQVIGTLEYMSPEQAGLKPLDVDTRSDIYSLGVLLYQLLTGSTPFSGGKLNEIPLLDILRAIRESEPQKPSDRLSHCETLRAIAANRNTDPRRLTALLRGDLDWVVMKALEKDRDQRYETAAALAMDLQRFLDDEPVLAGPPSALYRLRKFTRRNRVALTTGALVSTALIVGSIVSVTQAVRAKQSETHAQEALAKLIDANRAAESARDAEAQERKLAEQHRAEAEAMRAQAQANLQRARRAVDDMYTQVAEKWLANQPQMETVQREFLQKAIEYYTDFSAAADDTPELRLEKAIAFRRLAEIQHKLGNPVPSREAFEQAIRTLETLVTDFPKEAIYRKSLAEALHQFGVLLSDTGRYTELERVHLQAIALQKELAAEFPDDLSYQRALGRGHWYMGQCYDAVRRYPEGEQHFRTAIEIQNRFIGKPSTTPLDREQLAESHHGRALLLRYLGRQPEADKASGEARAIMEALVVEFPTVPRYRNELADICYRSALGAGPAEAESFLDTALKYQEQLVAEFPAVTDYRYDLARSYQMKAELALHEDRRSDAEQSLLRAISIGEKLVVDAPRVHYYQGRLLASYGRLGSLFEATGRQQAAEAIYHKAVALGERLIADFPDVRSCHSLFASSCSRLAVLLAPAERFDEILNLAEKGIAATPQMAHQFCHLAMNLATDPDPKRRNLQAALKLATLSTVHLPEHRYAWSVLGAVQYRAGNWQAACEALEAAEKITNGAGDGAIFRDLLYLAMAHGQLGHLDAAARCYSKAAALIDRIPDPPAALFQLQTEAAELLGIDVPSKPPAD